MDHNKLGLIISRLKIPAPTEGQPHSGALEDSQDPEDDDGDELASDVALYEDLRVCNVYKGLDVFDIFFL